MRFEHFVNEVGQTVPRYKLKTTISTTGKISYEVTVRGDNMESVVTEAKELLKKAKTI